MADDFNILDHGGGIVSKGRGYVTTGNVTATNVGATWTQAVGGFALSASVGDFVLFQPSFLYKPGANTIVDVAVKVGASFVRFASTGTSSAAVEGDPSMYFDPDIYRTQCGGAFDFVVEAGDLSGGNVTFSVVYSGTGTAAIVYASTDLPFRWRAVNYGPA